MHNHAPNTDAHHVAGRIGSGALSFNSAGTDDNIVIPAADIDSLFGAGTDFTVSFWWRTDGASNLANINVPQFALGLKDRFYFLYREDYNRYYAYTYETDGYHLLWYATMPAGADPFHHVALRRSGQTFDAWFDGA